ncbi:50S ribosomal protein L25/general stress protein Ctc [Pinisolibacter aquiterrae]|uniref:50S ribosomal protein L25/general stress protein Ctc n=1 Tax=Pinisolibacter aquiterrae TaxID=2815579 RepID=UPI001C3CD4E3|nr:50S ribosomal protein L25/general stress protein Ctc [Pinisolibacter aquiterrae]MBV5263370.1 50S ribosomal protein L25/general stress protein Ctc [Pinisolibacter aquiterrae]MCC8237552.1 50S ribosomal protein L25/general stress protein Ctc [Pinisolibacter aquiterrae]
MSRKSYELEASVRERVGKGAARALRLEGRVPAVIYGDKKPPLAISLPFKEADKRLRAGGFLTTVATIVVGAEKIRVIPKDYHMHVVKDTLTHVDFLRISDETIVTVFVPVHAVNQEASVGLKRGGALSIVHHEIECKCRADAIPESIDVDVAPLNIGASVHIEDVVLPKGVEAVVHEKNFTVLSITAPVGFSETAEAAETPAA